MINSINRVQKHYTESIVPGFYNCPGTNLRVSGITYAEWQVFPNATNIEVTASLFVVRALLLSPR